MRLIIQSNYENVSIWAANYIANKINEHGNETPFVLGFPTGSSPLGIYKVLIKLHNQGKVSFKNVVTFNMMVLCKCSFGFYFWAVFLFCAASG